MKWGSKNAKSISLARTRGFFGVEKCEIGVLGSILGFWGSKSGVWGRNWGFGVEKTRNSLIWPLLGLKNLEFSTFSLVGTRFWGFSGKSKGQINRFWRLWHFFEKVG